MRGGKILGKVVWTDEQKQAIQEKGSNILVAAAAGSGKTAVLVERIIHKILDEKIDIDQILVVTFTNAAASEMRERILEAIYQKIEENPEDTNLQKQLILLNKASICTIHSFCLEVIRNNFFEINISPNFRIGEQAEIELLKQDVLEDMFEEKYENQEKDFLKVIDKYTGYQNDQPLKDFILQIYNYISSSPFPEEWLEEKVEMFHLEGKESLDFSETIWGKVILKDLAEELKMVILSFQNISKKLARYPEMQKFYQTISQDIDMLEGLYHSLDSWEKAYQIASAIQFSKWPIDKKAPAILKEETKIARDKLKKKVMTYLANVFCYSSDEAMKDIGQMYETLAILKNLVLEFDEKFVNAKKEKNMIDFHDIEHFALQILVKKDKEGNYVPTGVAKKYQEKLSEIAIDEYQDSNLVQEYILSTISRGNNIFMVGDVKQSIYRFRQARPELFLEKYEKYQLKKQQKEGEHLKIQLFKNFRSRQNILDVTNMIFKDIMSKEVGDITYDIQEYLNLGANYPEPENNILYAGKAELHIIDTKEHEEIEEVESEERMENTVLEAKFVAKKIKELINSNYQVYDKKIGYRPIQYRDIALLLRATSIQAPIFEKEMQELGIPVFSDTSAEYLDSIEIQTIISVLKIMDNPRQDIPLVTVLRSPIGMFSDNDLVQIRLSNKRENFYDAMLEARIQVKGRLKVKLENFLENLENWRKKQEYLPLEELIWEIYFDTGYYQYVGLMPDGAIRQANLKMLFERAKEYERASFRGLFNFIHFIEKLRLSSNDLGAAKLIGENEDVVRMMSIHKSKGLEFPVVFLCGTGKKFNMQDLNQSILMHQDLGFGPKYVNYERKIEYNTLAKEAIRSVSKVETIAEEMRVLYVALTRAKEKLYITGISKDVQKDLEEKEQMLSIQKEDNRDRIHPILVKKYNSYLDWLELVYQYEKEKIKDVMTLEVHAKGELLKALGKKAEEKIEESFLEVLQEKSLKKNLKESQKEIQEKLEKEYVAMEDITIPTKMSVTEIKKQKQEKKKKEKQKTLEKQKEEIVLEVPNFLKDQVNISAAQRGTLVHMCMQRLQIQEKYDMDKIQEMIYDMIKNQIISEKEAENIPICPVLEFTKSEIWEEMKQAQIVEREKPFYLQIAANEVLKKKSEVTILVQGIIDLYYITKDNQLVLVDYKTDYVSKGKENSLIEKYKEQLEIYQKALEESLKRKVDKIYLYSTSLNKSIKVR